MKLFLFICPILVFSFVSCNQTNELNKKTASDKEGKLFTLLFSETTNIVFENNIKERIQFNFINYPYVYNGGGVSAGDINNDGLIDLYFTSNQGTNKLYLNQGNFEFRDITKKAGVSDHQGWSTGTTMVDINNDGHLDIYVSKSGSLGNHILRENKLFINEGNETFKEQAKDYGLNDPGFGTQAYFFDYDKDGDLDMYQVNHRADFENNTNLDPEIQNRISQYFSDQFYENVNGRFNNITSRVGIANSAWGLSASIGDFDNDGWEDIYVCNDFLQADYLYINNQDGKFINKVLTQFGHISQNSMGSDFADIDNDGFMDLAVMEMSPEDHVRSKSNMASMSTANFNVIVASGNHNQYMVNTLQLNQSNGYFNDIAQLSGISKTDWSWAPLLADFDEDGWNDLYVTNGIQKDLFNSDFRTNIKKKIASKIKMSLDEAIGMLPSNMLPNYIYQNQGNLLFEKKSKEWGLDKPSFSNGSTYADLDNDGDLDLIVNNVDDQAFIYRNNSTGNSISIKLAGPQKNPQGIGAKVKIIFSGSSQTKYQYLSRGYLSSVTEILHFGLGDVDQVGRIEVTWPDNRISVVQNPDIHQINTVSYAIAEKITEKIKANSLMLKKINSNHVGIDFKHEETDYNDFKRQPLLPYKLSQQGNFMSEEDVNGDGLQDVFIGGAARQAGRLYLQEAHGFKLQNGPWEMDKSSEDIQSIFFDYDNDQDMDLYVVSGSNEFEAGDRRLQDRLYENDGKGNFKHTRNLLPNIAESGATVKIADIDNDGDQDIFVGGRVIPNKYPLSPNSYLFENVGAKFIDSTIKFAPQLTQAGMITDAVFSDFDNDGDQDLIVVGEWSGIQIFENKEGIMVKANVPTLANSVGLWFSIEAIDIDEDGDEDYFVGNLGLNSKFKVGENKEFHIFSSDFDRNGSYDIVLTNKYKNTLVPARGLECSSEQMPSIKTDFTTFQSFATASVKDIYGKNELEDAYHIEADLLSSVFLKNNGDGNFEIIKLPNQAQISPIMDFTFIDIDGDGAKEILAVGNLYETEVETVRYDGSTGIILTYKNQKFQTMNISTSGFFVKGNARDIQKINDNYLFISKNDDKISVFKIPKK